MVFTSLVLAGLLFFTTDPAPPPMDPEVEEFVQWAQGQGYDLQFPACYEDVVCYGFEVDGLVCATHSAPVSQASSSTCRPGRAHLPSATARPPEGIAVFRVEVADWNLVTNYLGDEYLCVTFVVVNQGSAIGTPPALLFAERPSGVVGVALPVVTAESEVVSSLMFPILAPGGEGDATFCFQAESERGTFFIRIEGFADGPLTFEINVA